MQENVKLRAKSFLTVSIVLGAALILNGAHVSAVVPYVAERVNLNSSGGQMVYGNVQAPPSISQDGRYVAFSTNSPDIISGDTNSTSDIFVRDRKLGTTTRASVTNSGAQISGGILGDFALSSNGRFVLFSTYASGVTSTVVNSNQQLFLRDLKNNTTELASLTSSGDTLNDGAAFFDISADGRYIVFSTAANNVVPGDVNARSDVFVRDRKLETTKVLSKSSSGVFGNEASVRPSISCDGSYVTFVSQASNLVAADTNTLNDVFLVDRVSGDEVSNITINGNKSSSSEGYADISCNGETIVFNSEASNLVLGDTNNQRDVFSYNIIDSTFDRVNLDSSGNETTGNVYALSPNSIDYSGRYVVFSSRSSNLTAGDTNSAIDVFLRDIKDGTTQMISKRSSAIQTSSGSSRSAISLDGREVVFASGDTGYVPGDTNGMEDIFVSKTGI